MTKREALNGKPYAGNPHVRFAEGEDVLAATPRRGSLLYKLLIEMLGIIFNRSFWHDFIVADMVEEGRMMHEYE